MLAKPCCLESWYICVVRVIVHEKAIVADLGILPPLCKADVSQMLSNHNVYNSTLSMNYKLFTHWYTTEQLYTI